MENPDPSLCEKLAWKTLIHRCVAHAVRSSSVQQLIMSSVTHKVTTFCLDLNAPLQRVFDRCGHFHISKQCAGGMFLDVGPPD